MSAKKPNLWSDTRTALERFDPSVIRDLDPSRIPGYSEIVRANDIAKADELDFRKAHETSLGVKTKEDAYRMIGAKPRNLDVEFKWLPISGVAGGAIPYALSGQVDKYRQQGFDLVRLDIALAATDADAAFAELFPGCGFPPAARIEADGTIRRGPDVALYARNGEVARRWALYELEQAASRENAYQSEKISAKDGSVTAEAFSEDERSNVAIRERR